MSVEKSNLILANGEAFVDQIDKSSPGPPPRPPRDYSQARDHVRSELIASLDKLESIPLEKRFSDETVLCLRLHPDFTAKSYDPEAMFSLVPELEKVGSRNYLQDLNSVATSPRVTKKLEKDTTEQKSRMVFVRGQEAGFKRLIRTLDRPESSLTGAFKTDIQRIERFDLLGELEQLAAFDQYPDWKEGRVEIVLHPSDHTVREQLELFENLFRDSIHSLGKIREAAYSNGPLFVSCRMHREELGRLGLVNPLRTAHPLVFKGPEDLRGAPSFPAPARPIADSKSTTKVGIFDGGIDVSHPYLKDFSEEDSSLSIGTPPDPEYVAHGTAVASAVLYGPLNNIPSSDTLPSPPVSVVSFRVLPTSDPTDIDLYESIDVIEAVIPARKDISVYNVSLGPAGPILDDTISRFTFALDALAREHKVTFCVAVGNNGEQSGGMERVQSPSDLVNGLGVGAWTTRDSKKIVAPYSCVGPGRECGKVKPDLTAFGGCDQNPIHLISPSHGHKVLTYGTSFSSPLVASLAGQLKSTLERGDALLARAMLLHWAEHPDGDPDYKLGHGVSAESIDEMVTCGPNQVSILFQSSLQATKTVKLPLLLPVGAVGSGKIRVTWTVATTPEVDPNHPTDYTKVCIEDTLYPNENLYGLTAPKGLSGKKSATLHLVDDAQEIQSLLDSGWKQSGFPKTASGNRYRTDEQRKEDCTWEPVVRRTVSKKAESYESPFLLLHAIPRHGTKGRVDYAVIVTITATSDVDLYGAVLKAYPALQPVRLRSESELRIKI